VELAAIAPGHIDHLDRMRRTRNDTDYEERGKQRSGQLRTVTISIMGVPKFPLASWIPPSGPGAAGWLSELWGAHRASRAPSSRR